jgi:phosphate transport system substrate-binding protein
MRMAEIESCKAHGVSDLVEVKVGYDGITLAMATEGADLAVGTRDLYRALAARVPDPAGGSGLVANPCTRWDQIDPALPATPIKVLGPPRSSGTRDAFVELAMQPGCGQFQAVRDRFGRDREAFARVCGTIRTDGVYREAGEDDDLIVTELLRDPKLIGIFGVHFLEANKPRLKAVRVEGTEPSLAAIATGNYVPARPLFVCFKKSNLDGFPSVQRYVQEFTSEEAWSEQGYLKDDGMIPMLLSERQKYAYIAKNLVDPSCPPFCR